MTNEISPKRALLWAMIDRDYNDPTGRAANISPEQTIDVITAGFIVAVEHRFGADADRQAIDRYAAELPARYESGADEINPGTVAALIRTGLGEEGLIDGLTVDQIIDVSVAITYDVMNSPVLTERQREDFLDAAEQALED
jgi:hypothetical protein